MHDFVLIEKTHPSCDCWPNLIRKKKILNLSVEEVVNKYQGFEGELILIFPVKKIGVELKKIMDQCTELKKSENCLLLHVISGHEALLPSLKEQAFMVGYEVGVCEEEKTIYSSIFNEILFGTIDELIAYKDLLNENLLFPDKFLAKKYVSLHNELSARGKDVEDYEEMIVYEIWKYVEST